MSFPIHDGSMAEAGAIVLGLEAISTIPAAFSTSRRVRSRSSYGGEEPGKIYEDKDGVATTASEAGFATAFQTYGACSATILGLCTSIVRSVQDTIEPAATCEWMSEV